MRDVVTRQHGNERSVFGSIAPAGMNVSGMRARGHLKLRVDLAQESVSGAQRLGQRGSACGVGGKDLYRRGAAGQGTRHEAGGEGCGGMVAVC